MSQCGSGGADSLLRGVVFAFIVTLVTSFSVSVRASDVSEVVGAHVPQAQAVGTARLQYLLWNVYDATLFAPAGQWSENEPFALSLEYLMKLKGEAIAEQSVKEIRGQGFDNDAKLNDWFEQMRSIFPDVDKGTRLTGVVDASRVTRFYADAKLIGQVEDPEFGQRFFAIWLGDRTSQPKLRKQLVGENP